MEYKKKINFFCKYLIFSEKYFTIPLSFGDIRPFGGPEQANHNYKDREIIGGRIIAMVCRREDVGCARLLNQ